MRILFEINKLSKKNQFRDYFNCTEIKRYLVLIKSIFFVEFLAWFIDFLQTHAHTLAHTLVSHAKKQRYIAISIRHSSREKKILNNN